MRSGGGGRRLWIACSDGGGDGSLHTSVSPSIHPSIHVYLTFLRPSLPICLVAAPAPQRRSLGAALCFRTCTGRRLWLRRIALARGGGCGVSSVQKQAAAATTCAGGSQDSPDDSSVCKEVNLFSVGSGRTIFSRPLSILEQ